MDEHKEENENPTHVFMCTIQLDVFVRMKLNKFSEHDSFWESEVEEGRKKLSAMPRNEKWGMVVDDPEILSASKVECVINNQ